MEVSPNVSWYPTDPNISSLTVDDNSPKVALVSEVVSHVPHSIWNDMKYTLNLWWSGNVKKERKEACRRHYVHGVEVRDLGPDHFLCGEKGLFATEKFEKFDIIGEYTGRVVDHTVSGHYVACLEDKAHCDSLGIDAQDCGNEIRFINSYLNVAFKPNVTMRTTYINTYPHIIVVCMDDIEVGEEILLDYGKAYNEAYLLPKPVVAPQATISIEEGFRCLPGERDSDSEDEAVAAVCDTTTTLSVSEAEAN